MSDGGKGSAPRPFTIKHEDYANNWDAIFSKKKVAPEHQDNTGVNKNEFQDTLSTEDCVVDAIESGVKNKI
jgi:hypothetical protein